MKVTMEIPNTTGTNIPAILSTSFWTGALLPCACWTILMIWESRVSPPTFSAVNWKLPFWLTVPANTFSPWDFWTGTGSPVIILSSTYELPLETSPSTGIFSPGRTKMVWPTWTDEIGTSFSSPFSIILEVLDFAFSSNSFPKEIKVIITVAAS